MVYGQSWLSMPIIKLQVRDSQHGPRHVLGSLDADYSCTVNSVQWAPHELGAVLACASSDGKVSVLEFKEDGSWDVKLFQAHAIGCNAVAWAPTTSPGSVVQASGSAPNSTNVRRFVTGGSDNLVKVWLFKYVYSRLFSMMS